jgi:membrane-associated phospholipid phosphatase
MRVSLATEAARAAACWRRHPERPGAAVACAAAAQFASRIPGPGALVPLVALPALVARALPRGRVRAYGTFLAHSVSYLQAFELPHRNQAAQRRRLRIEGPIRAEKLVGGGVVPTARLQRLRRHRALRAVLDRTLGLTYFGWAPQRHAALLWLFVRHPERLARAGALISATFDTTLAAHAAAPTAPPWWSAKQGFLDDPLHRVTVDASKKLPLIPQESEDADHAANPWASFPSNHTATAVMVAIVLSEADPRAGALACGYTAMLVLALVYLGEHYVVDVVGGVAVATAVRAAEPLVRVPAQRMARLVLGRT